MGFATSKQARNNSSDKENKNICQKPYIKIIRSNLTSHTRSPISVHKKKAIMNMMMMTMRIRAQ